MTIFDIKPMSYWRCKYKNALYNWEHIAGESPRAVIEIDLLRQVNQRLRWELGCVLQQLDATNQRRGEEWHRMSKRLAEACDLAAERGRQLRWALLAVKWGTVPEPPNFAETPAASTNTPADGGNAEIGDILQATREGNAHEPAR